MGEVSGKRECLISAEMVAFLSYISTICHQESHLDIISHQCVASSYGQGIQEVWLSFLPVTWGVTTQETPFGPQNDALTSEQARQSRCGVFQ